MVGGETVEALPGEVTISESPRQGWALAEDQGLTVALDLELTPELVRSGLAREAVRLVQNARKDVGLDVGDGISLVWSASGETAAALRQHGALVAAEVLATRIREGDPVADQRSPTKDVSPAAVVQDEDLQLAFSIARASGATQSW
jgi:isoleucyl-tRNA synthetase